MTVEETKEWLNRPFYLEKKVRALSRLVEQRREAATGLVRASEGNDKGKNSMSKNGTESAIIMLTVAEEQYRKQKEELKRVTLEISDAISQLHDDDYEAILINRYLNYMTVEATAEFMHYATRTVKKKQKEAIAKLCTKMHPYAL